MRSSSLIEITLCRSDDRSDTTLPAKARYDAGTPHQVPNPNRNTVNYTIAISASPSGGGTVSGGGTFASGTSRTVTATANSGNTFANWTENGTVVSIAASYTFALNGNRNLVANFTVNSIAVGATPSNGGGSSDTVTATPNSGSSFADWTENHAELHFHAHGQPQPGGKLP